MKTTLFTGQHVRLAADEPEAIGSAFARWNRDAEYMRLLNTSSDGLWSAKKIQAWIEKEPEAGIKDEVFFIIHTLADDRLIGFTGLAEIEWTHGEAMAVIGIGKRECWGKGYGTEAMRLLLHYAFTELNLHCVFLAVFDYNRRAIRSYEKAGFLHEGRERQMVNRGGERHDVVYMSVLRDEWLAQHTQEVEDAN